MEEVNKRAQRIHHKERLKEARKTYWNHSVDGIMSERALGMVVNTPKPCSCWMCGKPKKHTMGVAELRECQKGLQDDC